MLKRVIDEIRENRRRTELNGETWKPEDEFIKLTQTQWTAILVDPYINQLWPDPADIEEFLSKKMLLGVKLIVET